MAAPVHPARRFWRVCEAIHAVTYFAPESRGAAKEAGLRGFWMGYFGFRAAPFGAASPALVSATFHNFAPAMVARSVPDAWTFASPEALLEARARSAAEAVTSAAALDDTVVAPAVDQLRAFARGADHGGRPLSSANAAVSGFDELALDLWQGCTTVREHRGDGHVATLVSEGLSGLQAHVLLSATDGVPAELLTDSRGWTVDDWAGAQGELRDRGLLNDDFVITDPGRSLRAHVEQRTDELSWRSIEATIADPDDVARRLAPVADAVIDAGVIPFPNPMGMPAGRPSELLT